MDRRCHDGRVGFFDQFLTPPPSPPRWRGRTREWAKPEAALAAVVPVERVLARSDQFGPASLAAPTGRRGANEIFRLAVVFADGRVATNINPEHAPPNVPMAGRAVLMQGGGSGGERRYDLTYWVYPLPPPGRLAFICEWPGLGLAETRVEIDAQPILDAAARSVQIWPENDEPGPADGEHQHAPGGGSRARSTVE